jgi:hypothetical protein
VRAVAADGETGDWLPLGTLVRLPGFKDLLCPRALTKPCMVTGNDLFLADSLATTPDFADPVDVPAEFTGTELLVPHPTASGVLYLKLRDDPATVQTLTLPLTVVPPAGPQTAAGAEPAQPAATAPRPAGNATQPPAASLAQSSEPPATAPSRAPPATAPSRAPPASASTQPATKPSASSSQSQDAPDGESKAAPEATAEPGPSKPDQSKTQP